MSSPRWGHISAVVLLVASIAALVQIRHLRLATQLECYLQTMRDMNTQEMVDARTFVRNANFNDPNILDALLNPQLDARIGKLITWLQTVSRLFNLRILDEEMMAIHIGVVTELWPRVLPIVRELRRRTGLPYLTDAEYLVYRVRRDRTITRLARRYPNNQSLAEGAVVPPLNVAAQRESTRSI